ncbi:hypothetical protein DFH11DRAFT_599918 [Phellopilus nigrolimitatus]|nr:hypothetical protein DFH11DRAFT_599918 [Phellopilus nigrolimitatus]
MAGMDISIDENTLRIIEGALTQIHGSNDPVSVEKLWALGDQVDVTKLSFHDIGSLDSALNTTKLVFRQLEATKNALFLLARSCEQRLSVLKAEMQPYFLHSGIFSLSDDVLALVFENLLLKRDKWPRVTPEHCISHVCRRFRSISLGLPKLWSIVTSSMSEKWVETRLLRSKTAGLAIDIYEEPCDDAISRFGQQVVPHTHRWQSFRLVTRDSPTSYRTSNRELKQHFANLELPALTFFEVSSNAFTLEDDSNDFDFYKSWEMPELRHADMTHHIPSDILHGSKTITAFDFAFYSDSSDLDIQKLMDFLSSLDNLTELSLRLLHYASHDLDLTDHIVLSKVKSFKLTTVIPDTLKVTLTSVRMPALTKLYLEIREIGDFSVNEWLDVISLKEYPSVKDLSFVYEGYARCALDLAIFFKKFPNMENLTLNTPNLRPVAEAYFSPHPRFHSLSLTHNTNIDSWLVKNLVERFETEGHGTSSRSWR